MKKVTSLSVLQQTGIKSPCHESWDAMSGNNLSRHCEKCNHSVIDLSAMSAEQATRLLENKAGTRLCVRYRFDHKGEILFYSRLQKFQSAWRSMTLGLATVLALLGLSTSVSAECGKKGASEKSCNSPGLVMGKPTDYQATPSLSHKSDQIKNRDSRQFSGMGEISPSIQTPAPTPAVGSDAPESEEK